VEVAFAALSSYKVHIHHKVHVQIPSIMHGLALPIPDESAVLTKAFLNAGKALGLSQADLGEVIGRDRSAFSRSRLDPASKSGELALLFIRCYRGLFVLVGGREEDMRHWMHTRNRDTGGIPTEQVRSVQGLTRVLEYLDAMRAKV
jgi:hypothetical protein